MENLIITGASGLVASELIRLINGSKRYNLFLISTHPNNILSEYHGMENVYCFDLNALIDYLRNRQEIKFKCLIHTAFSRSSDGTDLAKSLEYLNLVLHFVKTYQVASFINISSQSVYGQASKPMWTEKTPLAPNYMYALGKLATEHITNAFLGSTDVNYTNVRLCSVCEKGRFIDTFVKNAIEGVPIRLMGGDQIYSFIDIRDVASGLYRISEISDSVKFAKAYNLGSNIMISIREIAEMVKRIGNAKYNLNVTIRQEDSDIKQEVGMDSSLFMNTFQWHPSFNMEQMIEYMYDQRVCQ